jgi:hypothetical protein
MYEYIAFCDSNFFMAPKRLSVMLRTHKAPNISFQVGENNILQLSDELKSLI